MPRVRDYVTEWWTQPYLPWFTDHGSGHSQRVAAYAEKLASSANVGGLLALTSLERFILWASAWLHDLGMQSLLGMPLGSIEASGYERIRHEHPSQSAILIADNADLIGLPVGDTPLHTVVAYVARAHGTHFYADSVDFLRTYTRVRNQVVRGPLLGAILLMADEMDLHYERARPPVGDATLTRVSTAHALKHQCVTGADVEYDAQGNIYLSVTCQQMAGQSSEMLTSVERWIVEKLRRQIALVESEFSDGFGGAARLSRAIRVNRIASPFAGTEPSPDVLAIIAADLAQDDLINHTQALREMKWAVNSRLTAIVTGQLSLKPFCDRDGREDILRAVEAWARAAGDTLVISSFAIVESTSAATCTDVLVNLIEQADPGFDFHGEARDACLIRLVELIEGRDQHVVIVLSSIDMLAPADSQWMFATAVPRLEGSGDVSIVLSADPSRRADGLAESIVWVSTGSLQRDQVESHLARYVGAFAARSEAGADLSYWDVRSLRTSHLLELEREAHR